MTLHQPVRRARKALRTLAVAAIAVAFLAGCGSDTDDDVDAAVEDVGDQVAEELDETTDDDADPAVEDVADQVAEELDETTDEDAEAAVEDVGDQVAEELDDAAAEIDDRSAELAQVLRENDLESLASAVELVNAGELLGDGAFTFFAPNDEAFLELDADQLADLLSNPTELGTVLQNHIVTETIDSTALSGMTDVATESGNTLSITADSDSIMVGDATVVNADIEVGEGIIHVVDSVLVP